MTLNNFYWLKELRLNKIQAGISELNAVQPDEFPLKIKWIQVFNLPTQTIVSLCIGIGQPHMAILPANIKTTPCCIWTHPVPQMMWLSNRELLQGRNPAQWF